MRNEHGTRTARIDGKSLSYAWLHARVDEFARGASQPSASTWDRGPYLLGLIAAGVGVGVYALAPNLIGERAAVVILRICLAVECAGFAVGIALSVRRLWREMIRSREHHARQMDVEFERWRSLVAELRRFRCMSDASG